MKLQIIAVLLLAAVAVHGQESPYFVTYTDRMEEPGNLDFELSSTSAIGRSGQQSYFAPYLELEYGITAKWTSELYLEGQSTAGYSTAFTGWRWENRYKLLNREHWMNPVIYLEYENVNEASRIQAEIEGEGPDLVSSNGVLHGPRSHELEGKLIFSSDYRSWNISENFMLEKNFSESEGIEFGYALGIFSSAGNACLGRELPVLLREFCARSGSLRRFGQHYPVWRPQFGPLCRARYRLDTERQLDSAIFSRYWAYA